mgnify:CR=1 FL=1
MHLKKLPDKQIILLILFISLVILLASCTPLDTPYLSTSENNTFKVTTESTQNGARHKAQTQQNGVSAEEFESKERALCIRVIDGDTIVVLLNGREEKVRLIGIDTPEKGRHYFEEATKKIASFVLGKEVRLEKDVSERDKYGRLLRYVYVGSIFVNAELVRLGYAMVYTYPPDVKYADYFVKLQHEAREAKRGLWGAEEKKDISPGNTKQNAYYVASKKSDVFHYPWCQWAKKISSANLIIFKTRQEAFASGRRPCKICNP